MSLSGHQSARMQNDEWLTPPSVRHAVCDVRSRVERDDRTPDLFARIAV